MAIKLNFKVRCETSVNDTVCLSGNIPQLGMWETDKSFELTTNSEIYPFWVGSILVDQNENEILEFKAILKRGNEVFWEEIDNRAIQLRYLSQSIIFSYGSQLLHIIKIASFSDESDDDSIDLGYLHKLKLSSVIDPFEENDQSSNSSDEEKSFSEILYLESSFTQCSSFKINEDSFELLVMQ